MGLRLYQAPVESDVPPKPEPDRTTQQRSAITARRFRLIRGPDRARENRSETSPRRVHPSTAARRTGPPPRALQDPSSDSVSTSARTDAGASSGVSASTNNAATFVEPPLAVSSRPYLSPYEWMLSRSSRASQQDDERHVERRLRDARARMISRDARMISRLSTRTGILSPSENLSEPRTGILSPSENLSEPRTGTASPRPNLSAFENRPSEPYTLSNIRSTSQRHHFQPVGPTHTSSTAATGRRSRFQTDADVEFAIRASLDGLGDRNRSLSPETDETWDTLLTTLISDPQPPSTNTSFASATTQQSVGSTRSSQNRATLSPGTPLTVASETPGAAAQLDSACEHTDSESDLPAGRIGRRGGRRFVPTSQSQRPASTGTSRRSYADVAAQAQDRPDSLRALWSEVIHRPGGMDSLVYFLKDMTERNEISDEVLASAGLARLVPRDA